MEIGTHDIRVSGRLIRIARLAADRYEFVESPEPVVEGLRTSGTRVDLFTFTQRLPETSPRYAYPMEWDNVAALPVSTFDVWWSTQLDNKTRNMVRKSEKRGVEIREVAFDDELVRGIWAVYNETAVRQGKRNRHYGKDVGLVRREAATFLDRSLWIGAFAGNTLIGFAKLTTDRMRTQASLMHIVAMIGHRDKAPTNALIAQAVRSCAQRGIPNLVYASFAYGNKRHDSLSDFKRNNGFQRIDLPRYYVPLTRLGSAAVRLGLHRRFADRVPEPVLARFRRLRQAWYTRKFHSLAEPS